MDTNVVRTLKQPEGCGPSPRSSTIEYSDELTQAPWAQLPPMPAMGVELTTQDQLNGIRIRVWIRFLRVRQRRACSHGFCILTPIFALRILRTERKVC